MGQVSLIHDNKEICDVSNASTPPTPESIQDYLKI